VINGFENTWGPVMNLQEDQEGVAYLQNVAKFFAQVVPFEELQVARQLVLPGGYARGHRPLALASGKRDLVTVYLPAGGAVTLDLPGDSEYEAQWWYDPRTGGLSDATSSRAAGALGDCLAYEAPDGTDGSGLPLDWVLVLFTT
jgi:hypothetical protein